jgi:hypothetical protein
MSLPDVMIGGAITLLGGGGVAWWADRRADRAERADRARFEHERNLEREWRTERFEHERELERERRTERFEQERDLERERRTQERRESTYLQLLGHVRHAVVTAGRQLVDRRYRVDRPLGPVPDPPGDNPYQTMAAVNAFASEEVWKLVQAFEERRLQMRLAVDRFDAAPKQATGAWPLPPSNLQSQVEEMVSALQELTSCAEELRAGVARELRAEFRPS